MGCMGLVPVEGLGLAADAQREGFGGVGPGDGGRAPRGFGGASLRGSEGDEGCEAERDSREHGFSLTHSGAAAEDFPRLGPGPLLKRALVAYLAVSLYARWSSLSRQPLTTVRLQAVPAPLLQSSASTSSGWK